MKFKQEIVDKVFKIQREKFYLALPNPKEFISKEISLYTSKLKLLTFLGRKEEHSILLSIPSEGVEMMFSSSKNKSTIKVVISENFETFKWVEID